MENTSSSKSEFQIWARREKGSLLRKVSHAPVQLTAGSVSYVSPLPSKDGKQIFAVSGFERGELQRYNAKSKAFESYFEAISAQDVAFSDDGQWVAYVSFPDGMLWRSRADGSQKLQLSFPPLYAALPDWSSDEKEILFSASRQGERSRIYVVSSDGGAPQELIPADRGIQSDGTWSPDSSVLAFGGGGFSDSSSSIRLLNIKTRQITAVPESRGLYSPRWSPDGRYIAALTGDMKNLMLYDFQTRKWSVLVRDLFLGYPTWSRRGESVFFLNMAASPAVERVGIRERKVERVVSLKEFQMTGYWGSWLGLAPDDSPLLLKDTGAQDVVSLNWHEP
jgi:eukaryotic-like serine/threonine-protein kinase